MRIDIQNAGSLFRENLGTFIAFSIGPIFGVSTQTAFESGLSWRGDASPVESETLYFSIMPSLSPGCRGAEMRAL